MKQSPRYGVFLAQSDNKYDLEDVIKVYVNIIPAVNKASQMNFKERQLDKYVVRLLDSVKGGRT